MDVETDTDTRTALASHSRRLWSRIEPLRRRARARFEVDTRSLAAVRIALGAVLLFDLIHRAGHLETFYTDDGAYPLVAHEATWVKYNGLSIHALSGDVWFQQLLFLVAGALALSFLLGYRTRLVGLLSLLLLFSLHGRNPAVLNGGDRLFRVLLLVALLTPIGERWSVDALRRGSARERVLTAGTVALLLQPIAVFASNAVLKHQGDTWYAGEAVQIAMSNDMMTIWLGDVLVEYPTLLEAGNYAWIVLLAGSPVFLLLTVGRLRALCVFAYVGAFTGMALSMTVGLFPGVLTTAVLVYLPAPVWDALQRRVPDGLADRVPDASALGPLAKPPVERRLLARLRERGDVATANYAVAYAQSLLTVVGVMAIVWIVLFTAADVTSAEVPDPIDYEFLDEQHWGLYAPDPSTSYSWYVVEAQYADGTSVEAVEGGTVSFDRPPDAADTYESFRHRKFMQSVRYSGQSDGTDVVAQGYADWACERAERHREGYLENVTVHRMFQRSPVDGEWEEPRQLTVIEWDCDAEPGADG